MPLPYTVSTQTAGTSLAAADLNKMIANDGYLDSKINQQIQIGAGAMSALTALGSSPARAEMATNVNTYVVMDFTNSGSYESAEFGFELPADYDGGTITYHVNWTANSTSTNSIVMGLLGVAITDNGALDVAFGTAQEVTDANKSTAYLLSQTAESSALTIAGTPAAGKWVQFRLYRNSGAANDTLAATARVLGIVITYTRS